MNAEAFPLLSSPVSLGPMKLRNRVVMLPHGLVYAERSSIGPTDRHVDYYAARARGGVGLVCIESAYVSAHGDHRIPLVYATDPHCIPAYAHLADAIHGEGAAVAGQLTHYGNGADTRVSRLPLVGPSALPAPWKRESTKALGLDEIVEIRGDFARAAGHLAAAGLDAVDLKAGHDGLLRQFMSPLTNDRTDAYGGSTENRLRFLLEVAHDVRAAIGDAVALSIRLTLDECVDGGFDHEEALEFVRLLAASGLVDYIAASIAIIESIDYAVSHMALPEGYAFSLCSSAADISDLPVVAVGRIRRPEQAEQLLAEGKVAAVGMARQLIADPEWANKAFAGESARIRPCTACNQLCLGNLDYKIPISCTVNPYSGYGEERPRAAWPEAHVVVVGGGPAGLEAARVATADGAKVTLFEQSDRLGGQLAVAASVPGRDGWRPYLEWLEAELAFAGADIRLNQAMDAERVEALHPDLIVVATGSIPAPPPFPDAITVDAYAAAAMHAEHVAVVDCGAAGPGLWSSVLLALERGARDITVATPLHVLFDDLDSSTFAYLYGEFHRRGVRLLRDQRPIAFEAGRLTLENVHSGAETGVNVDVMVASAPRIPVGKELVASLAGAARVVTIGDALVPRDASAAIREGQHALAAITATAAVPG